MRRSIVPRGILTLTVAVALVAIPVTSASAERTLDPGTVDFGTRQVNTTSPPQTHQLKVFCDAPFLVCALIALAGGADNFNPSISTSGDFAQTNNCLGSLNGATPTGQSCTISTTFTPTSPGPKEGTLSTGPGGPTATLTGTGVTTETPPTPPEPGPPTPPTPPPTPPGVTPPTLDLDAKKQELKKKLTFFATANVDATLAVGGSVKDTTKQLAGGQRTKVKAKLKSAKRKKLAKKLNKSGKAKAKVEAAASSEGGTALDEIKVKLRD
jgi:hypothetical protein